MSSAEQAPPQNNEAAANAALAQKDKSPEDVASGADPRMKTFAHAEMQTMECFPGADPSKIVATEEALFGYENFGMKYTASGCASCAAKK